jgi:hypothetical protein
VTSSVANHGRYNLNGTQVVFDLPAGVQYVDAARTVTVAGQRVIVTLGRLAVGDSQQVQLSVVASNPGAKRIKAHVRSATTLPAQADEATVQVN